MARTPATNPQPIDPALLMQVVGLVETKPGPDGLQAEIDTFHRLAARLRELDLSAVEPALIFRAKGAGKRE